MKTARPIQGPVRQQFEGSALSRSSDGPDGPSPDTSQSNWRSNPDSVMNHGGAGGWVAILRRNAGASTV